MSYRCPRGLAVLVLAVVAPFVVACGEVENPTAEYDDRYLPLTAIGLDQATSLTRGGSADHLHSHASLPLSALSVEQATALTGGGHADALHTHAEQSRAWVACGTLVDLVDCALATHSPLEYEYGIAYLGPEPLAVHCTGWNQGSRLYNRDPLFVNANPPTGGNWGGYMFYTNTAATDDNERCGLTWRHQYWRQGQDAAGVTTVTAFHTNGCYGAEDGTSASGEKITRLPMYCRKR